MKQLDTITLPVKINTEEIDDTTNKLERLNESLREAKSLVDELASLEIVVNLKIDV